MVSALLANSSSVSLWLSFGEGVWPYLLTSAHTRGEEGGNVIGFGDMVKTCIAFTDRVGVSSKEYYRPKR